MNVACSSEYPFLDYLYFYNSVNFPPIFYCFKKAESVHSLSLAEAEATEGGWDLHSVVARGGRGLVPVQLENPVSFPFSISFLI